MVAVPFLVPLPGDALTYEGFETAQVLRLQGYVL
jgi:hypothetical protein